MQERHISTGYAYQQRLGSAPFRLVHTENKSTDWQEEKELGQLAKFIEIKSLH